MKMRTEGFIGLQVLIVTATIGIVSLVAIPTYKEMSQRAVVAEALTLAGELQGKLSRSFAVTGRFPTSNRHASAMISSRFSRPDFIRDLRIQPDRSGQTVAIKVFLRDGVVRNRSGKKQYVYILGNKAAGELAPIQWRCGATGLGPELLPDECRG